MDAKIGSSTHPRPPRGRRNKRLVEDGRLDDATLQLFEPSSEPSSLNPEDTSAKEEPTLDQQYLIKLLESGFCSDAKTDIANAVLQRDAYRPTCEDFPDLMLAGSLGSLVGWRTVSCVTKSLCAVERGPSIIAMSKPGAYSQGCHSLPAEPQLNTSFPTRPSVRPHHLNFLIHPHPPHPPIIPM
mmetsp:Transcript_104694/g.301928  ORF Transcript_104694/g.301928 Transcript_104694/m.301928 type:complete len:184 (-) Transcript_104694:1142-1693(-)